MHLKIATAIPFRTQAIVPFFLTLFLSLASAFPLHAVAQQNKEGLILQEFIFENPPFAECHASTILPLDNGGLLVSYFAGSKEGNADVGIWVSRYGNGKWSPPAEVANGKITGSVSSNGQVPAWNPVLFRMKDNSIALFYKLGPSPQHWWGMRINSFDEGKSWSKPARLPEGIYGPIKNKPVRLPDGTILSPSSIEDNKGWRIYFERSTDGGKTWEKTPCVPASSNIKAIQPSILIHPDGVLQAIGRTGHGSKGGFIYQTFSKDNGKTWSQLTATMLPNNNSGTDAISLKHGGHLLIYNHVLGRARTPLNIAYSPDGVRWYGVLTLEDEPNGEYSYPAIIQANDGMVHAVYTWKRKKIRHVVIDPKLLNKTAPLLISQWEGWPNPIWEKRQKTQ